MAVNTGEGFRRGAVKNRAQLEGPHGTYIKRDVATGRFMAHKRDGTPFKGVAKEEDGRRNR
jgi:hypothetical protein